MQGLAGLSILRDGFLVPVPDSSLPLLCSLVSLRRSGCASDSGLAASALGYACGGCLRIALDPWSWLSICLSPLWKGRLMG